MDLGLRDRACVVTGASGGIGRATSAALEREGASLLLVGRRAEPLRAVSERAEVLALDVTDPSAG